MHFYAVCLQKNDLELRRQCCWLSVKHFDRRNGTFLKFDERLITF